MLAVGLAAAVFAIYTQAEAGKRCIGTSLPLASNFPENEKVFNVRPTQENAIVRIDKVDLVRKSEYSSTTVAGFVYTLGNGHRYYSPREAALLSNEEREISVRYMISQNAEKWAARDQISKSVKASIGLTILRISSKAVGSSIPGLSVRGCLQWPRGVRVPD